MTTVLVVDDNPLDRKVIGNRVEQCGWLPQFAENGRQALDQLGEGGIDLVLTDLRMPELDGLGLVQQVKKRFPAVPVVLITAHGSEELAAAALQAGASSYVPKRNIHRDLGPALETVLDASASRRERLKLFDLLAATRSQFILGYDVSGLRALVGYCQESMESLKLCSATEALRLGTALNEALRNAIDHGNLELSSGLREADDGSYEALREQRCRERPYCDRRVHVEVILSRSEATYVIRDEGPGFDPSALPDPTDPENLLKPSGRGVMLMRTFMDEVSYNDRGNAVTLVRRAAR